MLEMMSWLLFLHVPGVKKKRWKKNKYVQKKINDSRISNFRISKKQSQIKHSKDIRERKKTVKIYQIDPYFYEH